MIAHVDTGTLIILGPWNSTPSTDDVVVVDLAGTCDCCCDTSCSYEISVDAICDREFKDDNEPVETEEFDRPTAERPTPQHEPEPLDHPPKVDPRHRASRYLPQGPKGIEVEKR